ncbi:MAG: sigma-70 family RNA polymerase sigma factor [Eubacterium sp.]|nr:sigma-70 family RNA polymerase sigma factor [Eubacterium sp.]
MNNIIFNNYKDAVAAAISGNQEGFSYLYEKTFKNKYYVALKYMKNEDAASDVVQDSYMRAFQNLSMLQDPERFPGWMGMIVANTAKNYLKKKNPVLFSEMDQVNDEGDVAEYQDTLVEERADFNPEEYYSKKEISDIVNEMIDSLPEEQRICMIMFYLEGQSIEEIAGALECSKGTVGSRLNYGRQKIKAKAEELQKRGYKLYSFSPVVLFAALLRNELNGYILGTAAAGGAAAGMTAGTAGETLTGGAAAGETAGAAIAGNAGEASSVISGMHAGDVLSGINAGSTNVGGTNVGKTVAEGAGKTAGSTAGKTGFLSTVAGKVVAAVAGTVIVGGLVAGIIALTNDDKKEDKKDDKSLYTEYALDPSGGKVDVTSEQTVITDATEQIATEDTEASTEATEVSTEDTASTEAVTEAAGAEDSQLTEYLEKVLIPEYGIYDPGQDNYSRAGDQYVVYSTYVYDKATGQLLKNSEYLDVTSIPDRDNINYGVDLRGIYYASVEDFDADGKSEMIVIRGTGAIDNNGVNTNRAIAELYEVSEGEVKLTRDNTLFAGDSQVQEIYEQDSVYEFKKLCITEIDGHKYLMIHDYPLSSDISGFYEIAKCDLADLYYDSYLYQSWWAIDGTDYSEVIYADSTINKEHFDEGTTYDEFGSYGFDAYAREKGYVSDKSICIMNVLGGEVNDFQKKYLYGN